MTRHSTAADKELPEDLPQVLWAADRVWVRRGGHTPPLAPLSSTMAPKPSSSSASATSGSSWVTGRTTSPLPASSPAPAAPQSPWRHHPGMASRSGNCPPRRPCASASTSRPRHRQRQLTLEPFFLPRLPGFFARPGEASSSHYPQRNRGPPAWQQDYTIFGASRNREAGGSSLGTPGKGCLRPSSQHESSE
jgi:hypothetical protein